MSNTLKAVPKDPEAAPFLLARCRVAPELNRVETPRGTVQVEPKVMAVLLLLASRPGEVIRKEELLLGVWNGVHVTEDVLVRAIGELRRLFGEAVVETIRGKGYRLVAPILSEPPSRAPSLVSRFRTPLGLVILLGMVGLGGVSLFREGRREPRPVFTPLTTLEGNEYDPAFSPEGTRVAFAWDGGSPGRTDLYVKALGEESVLRLTDATALGGASVRAPAWSPDGRRIAFVRERLGECALAAVASPGGPVVTLAPCGNAAAARFSWSPDGNTLAFSRRLSADRSASVIHLLSLGDGVESPLRVEPEGTFVDASPRFSPDGKWIAFERDLSDNVGDLYMVPRDGGTAKRLTWDNADLLGFTWLDGSRLAFSSNRAGMFSLWTVSMRGEPPSLLAGGGRKLKHPTASANGSVAYEAWEYDMNLRLSPLEGATERGKDLARASDEWTFEPRLSPDERRIVFVSTRSGSYELWTSTVDGQDLQRLTSFGGPYVGTPAYSPDSRSVVFVARPKGFAQVFDVDAAGGAPRALTNGPGDAVHPSFSADGRRILFGSHAGGDWQIQTLPVEGGEASTIVSGGYRALESREADAILFTRAEGDTVYRRELLSGRETRVAEHLFDPTAWGVIPEGLFHLDRVAGSDVPFLTVERRRSVVRYPVADLAWPGLEVSSDGKTLLYSRLGRHESNLVLLSFRKP